MNPKIIYTKTDEAPALASASLLPIISAFIKTAGIDIEIKDISLAGRIISCFSEYLTENQIIPDDLMELSKLVKKSDSNIIKLPNISASIPQLQAAIRELQGKGYKLPEYPGKPQSVKDFEIKSRYDLIKGSAVNPVLREGNSDRRAPKAVKKHAMKHPHTMGKWSQDSKTHVSSMKEGDFYGSEQSVIIDRDKDIQVVLINESGEQNIILEKLPLLQGEILDSSVMSIAILRHFLKDQLSKAKEQDLLFSLQVKTSMMKVSDPIIFGHLMSVFFEDVFEKYNSTFSELGITPENGLGELYSKLEILPENEKQAIQALIGNCLAKQPRLAMVNSEKGITNLHVSSDVLIDASMPAAIRSSGKMWDPEGNLNDVLAVIPDRAYAGVYQKTIEFCKTYGAFDPQTMGNVSNVGLMAQQAEEYGSHDKTFEIEKNGTIKIIDESGTVLMEQQAKKGDIFRMCQVKDEPIRNWVKLAVKRARTTSNPAVFWLDSKRPHDANIIRKVNNYLPLSDTESLDIRILPPEDATLFSLKRLKEGKDTISVTGNVLRDYLTDLFPILELGTSSKMLSIVPLMNGGGLFETGAGGSAPKHVEQFTKEGHLRWDSLGEFLALAASLEYLGEAFNNEKAIILSKALDEATEQLLENNNSPSRKVSEPDNRSSHFYLALYWARALSRQDKNTELQILFSNFAEKLSSNKETILKDFNIAQGNTVDLKGYYWLDENLLSNAMRPSTAFNEALISIL
ncbi:MAG: NADP-dependent isocitrate dehydrogenase [Spirochaetia bacterium]|jgi:isocitrate dehydrogenase|nr:NADP-dependent isocitrate dehydrogenase [Spirochaetia bacterium]